MKHILVIAGTDSSGGAGLGRDVATATGFGLAVRPIVTAVTAQTDDALVMGHPMPLDLVRGQIETALSAGPPGAIKIGMLATAEIAATVAEALSGCTAPVVLDPVLATSSGGTLFAGGDLVPILPLVSLLTPNLPEAARLTGTGLAEHNRAIAAQAKALRSQGVGAVLIKGGHGSGPHSTDHLFDAAGHAQFSVPRLARGRRGTGCTLATAIACRLALGDDLHLACARAKEHVHRWISDVDQV